MINFYISVGVDNLNFLIVFFCLHFFSHRNMLPVHFWATEAFKQESCVEIFLCQQPDRITVFISLGSDNFSTLN